MSLNEEYEIRDKRICVFRYFNEYENVYINVKSKFILGIKICKNFDTDDLKNYLDVNEFKNYFENYSKNIIKMISRNNS